MSKHWYESLICLLSATLMLVLVEMLLIVVIASCERIRTESYVSAVSTGTGKFAFHLLVDSEGKTLTLELTKKPDVGPYYMDYTIDGDLSLLLEGTAPGDEVPLPGFDTMASFDLPALEEGSHKVDVSLRHGTDTQSASVSFEIRGEEGHSSEVKCERLAVGITTTIYEGNELPFVVAVSPEECTQKVTWTNSNESVVSICHDEEWDEWSMMGLKPGSSEVIFSCGEKKVRKTIKVLENK